MAHVRTIDRSSTRAHSTLAVVKPVHRARSANPAALTSCACTPTKWFTSSATAAGEPATGSANR
jgi:hypothetical protein